jgi:CrcB protein
VLKKNNAVKLTVYRIRETTYLFQNKIIILNFTNIIIFAVYYIYLMIQNIILIGTGGFLGSVLRYGSGQLISKLFETTHPTGTFFVNVIGSFIIGIVLGMFDKGAMVSDNWKLFLAVGFCGGFTTFSAFAIENFNFLQSQQFGLSLLYVGLSVILGLAAVYFGFWLVK